MRRQDGFTLIELLLVLAIIGIISAIAIPALLGQRARARDRATVSNVVGHLGDLVGQYEQARDAGLAPPQIIVKLDAYLVATVGQVPNPWGGQTMGFNTACRLVTGAATQSEFEAAMLPNAFLGKVRIYVQHPASGGAGFLGLVANLDQPVNGNTIYRKAASLE